MIGMCLIWLTHGYGQVNYSSTVLLGFVHSKFIEHNVGNLTLIDLLDTKFSSSKTKKGFPKVQIVTDGRMFKTANIS